MELERVARRLAVDQGYRRRAAEGLRAAAGGGGNDGGADVLRRVKRLNEYLATGKGVGIQLQHRKPCAGMLWG